MACLKKYELEVPSFSPLHVPYRLHPPLLFEAFLVAHQTKLEGSPHQVHMALKQVDQLLAYQVLVSQVLLLDS
ncbi:unnamed protein product [Microthlaspi erraticum]|uniref:Uncharacterized protein n=1 Tax=Microthlaspi erraticum TaxID=1685480 RepID=A0A6D2I6D6_9BRAS|nr:unnamed protein product [Microthlaspi erraticum]